MEQADDPYMYLKRTMRLHRRLQATVDRRTSGCGRTPTERQILLELLDRPGSVDAEIAMRLGLDRSQHSRAIGELIRDDLVKLTRLFSIENSFVALLVVCLDVRGLVQGNVDRAVWDRSLTADGLRSPMWLYAYEAVTQGFLPRVDDGFINQDPYFTLLRGKRIQFLDVTRGYVSIATTLRTLRGENERSRRMREAIQDEDFEELDDLGAPEENWDDFEMNDIY